MNRCRICGAKLIPYENWPTSRIIRYDYICATCNGQGRRSEHWTRHIRKLTSEHTGFLDIETTGHDANFGIVLCYCIANDKTDKIFGRRIVKKDLSEKFDKRILVQFLKDMEKFSRIVTYYGTKFDIPFLRTRCLYHQLPFPEYGSYYHTDVYYLVKHKLRLGRNNQEIAVRFLTGESSKTHYGRDHWIKAMTGNETSLRYIYDHCKRDVRDLKKLYQILRFQRGYSKRGF